MSKDVLITPASGIIEWYETGGNLEASIELDNSNNLIITGNVVIGDAGADIVIGDGVTAANIVFEQGGAIFALATKTLTLGSNNSSLAFATNVTITGFANISSTLAAGNTTITGFINVSSTANIGGVLTARANVVANGQLIVANVVSLGNTTVTGFINVSSTGQFGGNVTITGTTNTSVALNVGANVNLSTSTINVGNATINSVISSSSLDLSGNRIRSLTHTSSNTDLQTFDSFAVSAFRSAQYSVQLTSGTDYHVINLSLVHDDTTVFLAQYGEIFDNVSLGTFDAAIATGNVNVQFTPTNAVTVLKAVATMIKV